MDRRQNSSSPPPYSTNPPVADADGPASPPVRHDSLPRVDREPIQLKVIDNAKNELVFMIRPTAKLDKVMIAYCQRQSRDIKNIRFHFDGQRIPFGNGDTPNTLEMEDGDVIEVTEEQIGGGPNAFAVQSESEDF